MSTTSEHCAELLGLPRIRHCDTCTKCGGALVYGYTERSGRNAYLFDFERIVRYCEECQAQVEGES
jgi:hypothetical protein